MKKIRIGGGAGYGGDRIEPALDLIKYGDLDYIIFECLAERTIALAQQAKNMDPRMGYNELMEERLNAIFPLIKDHPVKIITNMGAANPLEALKLAESLAEQAGLSDLKILGVLGDDILADIDSYMDYEIMETGERLASIKDRIISANAYLGAEGIVKALNAGADVVITGRVADPALVLGPLIHEFGWNMNDSHMLGKGIALGHLLECGAQVCGGYYADPPYKDVPDLWNVGFPIGEMSEDGEIFISKLPQAGGLVNRHTVSEQLIYEIHNPEEYFTPDVTADFFMVELKEESGGVLVTGASGKEKNGSYKVSIAYRDGYIGEGEISYCGSSAVDRAELALSIIKKRLKAYADLIEEDKYDIIGVDSMMVKGTKNGITPQECRIRVAVRTKDRWMAQKVGREVEALYTNGPSGGGGARQYCREIIAIASILIPAADVNVKVIDAGGEEI